MKRTAILSVAGLVLAGIALSGCTTTPEPGPAAAECTPAHPNVKTVSPGELTVASHVNPPFSDIDGNTLSGAEGELITEIAKLECLKIVAQPGGVGTLIPSVQAGRADTAIGSWYRTAERNEIVLLSDPVITVQLAIASRDDSNIKNVADLKGHAVGSVLGSLWISDLQALIGTDNLKLYDTIEGAYADLKAGRTDAVFNSHPTAVRQIELGQIKGVTIHVPKPDDQIKSTLTPGQTNFVSALGAESLQKAINDNLATLRKSGEFDKILAKYKFDKGANNPEPYSKFN